MSELKDFESLNIQLDLPDRDIGADPVVDNDGEDTSTMDPNADGTIDREFANDSADADDFDELDLDDADNVASLDAARAAANANQSVSESAVPGDPEIDSDGEPATVLPLKKT